MRRRRLEDRIHDLCERATENNWRRMLGELRNAMREHALRVANRNAAAVVGGMPHILRERRKRTEISTEWIPCEFETSNDDQMIH